MNEWTEKQVRSFDGSFSRSWLRLTVDRKRITQRSVPKGTLMKPRYLERKKKLRRKTALPVSSPITAVPQSTDVFVNHLFLRLTDFFGQAKPLDIFFPIYIYSPSACFWPDITLDPGPPERWCVLVSSTARSSFPLVSEPNPCFCLASRYHSTAKCNCQCFANQQLL